MAGQNQFKVKSNISGNVEAEDTSNVLKKGQGGCGCGNCAGGNGGGSSGAGSKRSAG